MSRSRVALVTGAGRGIGRAIAVRLAREGHAVALIGRTAARLEETAAVIRQLNARALCAVTDVAVESSVQAAVRATEEQLGPVEILVNNAGIIHSNLLRDTTTANFRKLLDTNLVGPFLFIREVLRGMQERGWGRIINIASAGARTGFKFASAYCSSKHGLIGLTRVAALEVAESGVTVNAICPGFTDTDMITESAEKLHVSTGLGMEAARATFAAASPLGRLVAPIEIAHVVAMLASDASSAVNGQTIGVDGGQVL
jgi:NAD(P)-dependent dehydrogenase (short-subunit alcohol dehydrogenase family)